MIPSAFSSDWENPSSVDLISGSFFNRDSMSLTLMKSSSLGSTVSVESVFKTGLLSSNWLVFCSAALRLLAFLIFLT